MAGAFVGAIATIGASVATGWTGREQARITARSEHVRQRREPREAAYRELIGTVSAARNQLSKDYFANAPEEALVSVGLAYFQDCQSRCRGVREAWRDVALLGPAQVTTAAGQVGAANEDLLRSFEGLVHVFAEGVFPSEAMWDVHERAVQRLGDTHDVFVVAAQEALDDDGTRPQGRRKPGDAR